jgi:hypothetical protein
MVKILFLVFGQCRMPLLYPQTMKLRTKNPKWLTRGKDVRGVKIYRTARPPWHLIAPQRPPLLLTVMPSTRATRSRALPLKAATSCAALPRSICSRAWSTCSGDSFGLSPNFNPRRLAAFTPALVRSVISPRSSSASNATMCSMARPVGVTVSMASVMLWKRTPRAWMSCRMLGFGEQRNRSSRPVDT